MPDSNEPDSASPERSPLRIQAILLAFALLIPAVYATANLPQSSMFSLMAAPVILLLAAVILNLGCLRFAPRLALSQGELTFVFSICAIGCAVAAEWTSQIHSASHGIPFVASGNPTVTDRILPNLKETLFVKDIEAVRDLGVGQKDASYVWGKLPVYGPRILGWCGLIGLLVLMFGCINALMRGLWCQREKLAYPILQLPLAIADTSRTGIYFKRVFWIAFGVMFAIDMLNGLNYLYPSVPRIPLKQVLDTGPFLTEAPWSSLGELPLGIYPFLAALAIFMPTDLLISLLAFFCLRKLLHLGLGTSGMPQNTFSGTYLSPGPPYLDEQVWGGVIALFVSALWFGRQHIRDVWRAIRSGEKADDGGPSHRSAASMFAAALLGFMVLGMANGVSLPMILGATVLFLVFSVVISRIRAQLGPPTHEFAFFGPNSVLNRFAGTSGQSDAQIVWLNQVLVFMNRISRTHPMPPLLESLKLADMGRLRLGRVWVFTMISGMVAFALASWFYLVRDYRLGAPVGWMDGVTFASNAMNNPKPPDATGMAMTGAGFGIVMLLDAIRIRFLSFPLHPVGYVLGMSYGIDPYWFGLALALGLKVSVQRYLGSTGYEKLKQAALGIMLAEYLAEAIWMVMALVTKQSTYTIGFEIRSLGKQ